MIVLTDQKRDALKNALTIGMSISDAYIYAGLTPQEIEAISNDDDIQRILTQITKQLEFKLLSRMDEISQKQLKLGKEVATTWLLEKLYPRYSNKPQDEAQAININLNGVDPATLDTVEMYIPTSKVNEERADDD